MEEKFNNLFLEMKKDIFRLIQEKNVDIDLLAFNLGISRKNFIEKFNGKIDDCTFYFQTLNLLENWEV